MINAAAGALVRAADADRGWHVVSDADDSDETLTSQKQPTTAESGPAQLRRVLPTMLGNGYGERRCASCEYFTTGANGEGNSTNFAAVLRSPNSWARWETSSSNTSESRFTKISGRM